jgi:hypothetical protein
MINMVSFGKHEYAENTQDIRQNFAKCCRYVEGTDWRGV